MVEESSMPRPSFVGEQYTIAEIDAKNGHIVEIGVLSELPPNIREELERSGEELKDGVEYVIKKYPNDSAVEKYVDRVYSLANDVNQESPEQDQLITRCQILKQRQKAIVDYFEDIPKIVVKSHFFVAQDEFGEAFVYEIQEKIEDLHFLKDIKNMFRRAALINGIPLDKLPEVQKQLSKFYELMKSLLGSNTGEFHDRLPDLNEANIAFTGDGEIRLFDTNVVKARSDTNAERGLAGSIRTAGWVLESINLKLLNNKQRKP
jgi:hypothetical protein